MRIESWLLWALLSATFAALTAVFAKLGLQKIDSDVAQLVRTAIVLAAIALPLSFTAKWDQVAQWNGRTWLFLVLSGLATSVSWICYFRALDLGDATRVSAVDKLSVAMVAVIAAFALHERLGVTGWCGVGLVTFGLILISQDK